MSTLTLNWPAPRTATPSTAEILLRRHKLLIEDRPLGRQVHCHTGRVWITFEGCPEDIILEAGDSHACTRARRLVIQALLDAQITLR